MEGKNNDSDKPNLGPISQFINLFDYKWWTFFASLNT